jgi:hypothetical protein
MCRVAHGEPTDGADAAHSCGNRGCVNPRHLRWASRSENQMDRVVHGTSNRGERCASAKLGEAEAREIKALLRSGATVSGTARAFGVHANTVRDIKYSRTWAWLV